MTPAPNISTLLPRAARDALIEYAMEVLRTPKPESPSWTYVDGHLTESLFARFYNTVRDRNPEMSFSSPGLLRECWAEARKRLLQVPIA
jgi:hypothetical protein